MRDYSTKILAYVKKKKKGISSSKKNGKLSDTGALNYQEEKFLVVGWEALESLS